MGHHGTPLLGQNGVSQQEDLRFAELLAWTGLIQFALRYSVLKLQGDNITIKMRGWRKLAMHLTAKSF
jgi:hypothetical protein